MEKGYIGVATKVHCPWRFALKKRRRKRKKKKKKKKKKNTAAVLGGEVNGGAVLR